MASSTKTLLEVSNDVLLMAGERPVLTLGSNPVARKVAACLQEAVLEVSLLDDWSFTRERIGAISWVGERAELGNVQRVIRALYGEPSTGYRRLVYLDSSDFDRIPVTTGDPVGACWTVDGYGAVRLTVAPSTVQYQNRVKFDVIKVLNPPTLDTHKFPLPDRFMPLIVKRALSLFVLRHLDDAGLSAQYDKEFELMVQLFRNRERYVPRGSANMYRGRR
jgi:hypothetical protein